MSIRWMIAAALAGFAALAIGACGGSSGSGIASKSPGAILAAAGKALSAVHSVHISGITSGGGGSTVGVDLSLVSGQGARGKLTVDGLSVQVVSLGGKLYMNGDAAFWKRFANATVGSLLAGKWVETTSGAGSFAPLFNLHSVVGTVLQKAIADKALRKGGTSTIDGQSAIAVTDAGKDATLDVATSGVAYPLELITKGASGGHIVFSAYNQPVSLTPPSPVVHLPG